MIAEKTCYAIVYFAEAFIAWLYYEYLFARKQNLNIIYILFLIGYATLFGVYHLEITVLNTVSFFIINFILSLYLYRCTVNTAILHSAYLSFIMTISEVLAGFVMTIFVGEFAAYTYNISVMIPMAIMSKLLYLVLALIGARIISPHKFASEDPQMMVIFCSLPIISALFSVFAAYLSLYSNFLNSSELIIVASIFALLFINLIFFVLYNYQQKVNTEYLSLQLSMQKEEADVAYYKTLQEQSENQRALIHDIKNHLSIIDGLAKTKNNEKITEYIDKMDITLDLSWQSRLCNDPILNLLLLRYANDCKEKKINFICDIREKYSNFMDAPCETTFYGNLLSNAVESADKSQEKLVEISVIHNADQEIVIVSVLNSCDSAPIMGSNGRFLTQKRDAGIHGVGLKSIERVVEKYHGVETMYFDDANKQFHHIIQFPVCSSDFTSKSKTFAHC